MAMTKHSINAADEVVNLISAFRTLAETSAEVWELAFNSLKYVSCLRLSPMLQKHSTSARCLTNAIRAR